MYPSTCLSVYLSRCLSLFFFCLSIYISTVSVSLCVCLSVCLSVCLHLSIYPSIPLSLYLSILSTVSLAVLLFKHLVQPVYQISCFGGYVLKMHANVMNHFFQDLNPIPSFALFINWRFKVGWRMYTMATAAARTLEADEIDSLLEASSTSLHLSCLLA